MRTFRIHCSGTVHRIIIEGEKVRTPDHEPGDAIINALAGTPTGCHAVVQSFHNHFWRGAAEDTGHIDSLWREMLYLFRGNLQRKGDRLVTTRGGMEYSFRWDSLEYLIARVVADVSQPGLITSGVIGLVDDGPELRYVNSAFL